MTASNLGALFTPRSIALIGASNEAGSVGQVVARNLLGAGFDGPVMLVNPHEAAIESCLSYRAIADLPLSPDLAVIATPAATVPGIVSELGARGCRAAIILSAGFEGAEGVALRQKLMAAARPFLMRIVGPNCLGVISTLGGINASFSHLMPARGGVALVSQSGAVAAAAIDWAAGAGVGFSHVVTIGDGIDVDLGDLLDQLAADAATRAILIYAEGLTDGRKFMSAARTAALAKPVVMLKAGRSAEGARAALSHTGALAGSDLVCDAALRRAGVLRATDLGELLAIGAALASGLQVPGDRLAILTNGGGAGVLAADALSARGGRLAQLSPATLGGLGEIAPPHWSGGNPVDILGDAKADDYAAALSVLIAAPEVDAVLVMNCPTAVADGFEAAEKVALVARSNGAKPVLACWLGEAVAERARRVLTAAGQPAYETPEAAVGVFMALARHQRSRSLLFQTPDTEALSGDTRKARRIIHDALAEKRTVLTDPEARSLLAAYGVPVVESCITSSPDGAARIAARLSGPLALKILSPDISHKSEVGGVALDLAGAQPVRAAAQAMLDRLSASQPTARIEGFTIEPMIDRARGEELLAGISHDPVFGPVVLFGEGGVATEVIADRCVALPPLDGVLARDMISRTRVARRLTGYRNRPPVNMQALAEVLNALGRLALDFPEVAELDINPLLTTPDGVLALDARVVLQPAANAVRPAMLPTSRGGVD